MWKFREIRFSNPRVDRAHLWTSGMTWPKNGLIWSNISGSTGPIFAVFTPYKRALSADDGSVALFPIYQGRLPWQPNNIAKMYQCWLIPHVFGTLELENELQYHGQAICFNKVYDACISCENFVKFGPVTPELTGLICERLVWHGQKNGLIWSNISGVTGPNFTKFSRNIQASFALLTRPLR